MKLSLLSSAAVAAIVIGTSASAVTISNVSYTDSSVTFTIDGTMPTSTLAGVDTTQFSIRYGGDVYIGSGFTANTWSGSVFDGLSFGSNGNTGIFGATNPYTWSRYNSSLLGATASTNTVTVSFGAGSLNTSALNPVFDFVLGNGNDSTTQEILQTVVVGQTAPVPLPAALPLLGFALAGLYGFQRRQRPAA
jgi:hypothetical protein